MAFRNPVALHKPEIEAKWRIDRQWVMTLRQAGLSGGTDSNLLSEPLHFVPVGTRRFNSSNQFSTTLICVGAACAESLGLSIRKRWPSGDTS